MRIAVIPAAGMGTRFRPATSAVPKELLPVYDTPALQIVIDEARGAGIERIVVISGGHKPAVRSWIDATFPGGDVVVVDQDAPRGLGHAIACARDVVAGESFAVLLPDELMGDSSLLRDLIADHETRGWSSIGVVSVPRELTSSYGCVSLAAPLVDGRAQITDVVEKPNPADAPSDLAIVGRYVLEADIFPALERLSPAKNGELQLSDALAARAREGRAGVVVARCSRHDTGTPLGMLTAVVDRTLARPDVGASLRTWLTQRLSQR